MKKATIRQLEPDESQDKTSQLRILAYPDHEDVRDTGFFDKMYDWYQRHPLADHMQRWISETEDGEVVGHLAAMPLYYRVDGERIIAHTPGDYMVHPHHSFQALALMRRFFKSVDNCFACDMVPAVITVETRFGAEVAGQMQYAAKLLNVSQLPMPSLPERLQKALGLPSYFSPSRGYTGHQDSGHADLGEPEPVPQPRPRAPIPAPLKSALNGGLRALDRLLYKGYGAGYEVETIHHFDESFDDFFEKVAAIVPCIQEKDSAFLNWRYGPDSPTYPVEVFAVRGNRGLLGYAVVKFLPKTGDAFILDLMSLPGYPEVARALLRECVRYFRKLGAPIVRYRYLESPATPGGADLRRLGFFSRGESRRNSILVGFEDKQKHAAAVDLDNWSYNIGDGEPTFWMR
jgi:hypothetical protein